MTYWNGMVRRKDLIASGIPSSVIDRYEIERPGEVKKLNPVYKNSPRLYDKGKLEAWWNKCANAKSVKRVV